MNKMTFLIIAAIMIALNQGNYIKLGNLVIVYTPKASNYSNYNSCTARILEINESESMATIHLWQQEILEDDTQITANGRDFIGIIPIEMLHQFSIKSSSSIIESKMCALDKEQIVSIYFDWMLDRFHDNETLVSHHSCLLLIAGQVMREFGVNGFNFLMNKNFELDNAIPMLNKIFDEMSNLYMKNSKQYSLKRSDVLKYGDLVRIKQLKQQNNTDLQMRAQILSESFGKIMPNVRRLNKRNQTEYEIRSILKGRKNITLGIRPKYLYKIANIYIHKLPMFNGSLVHDLLNQLLNDESNHVMVIPLGKPTSTELLAHNYVWSADAMVIILNKLANLKVKQNLIYNVFSYIPLMNSILFDTSGLRLDEQHIHVVMENMHWMINKNIFDLATERMLSTYSGQQFKRHDLSKIVTLFRENFELMTDLPIEKYDVWMQRYSKKLTHNLKDVIGNLANVQRIARNTNLWKHLFENLSCTLEEIVAESDINYYKQCESSIDIRKKINGMTVWDIILNYLEINKRGHTFHIICWNYDIIKGLDKILAIKLNKEWNINNVSLSNLLVSRLLKQIEYQ
eukprot:251394_1